MQARWDVMTTSEGYKVSYRNLQSDQGMECGTYEGAFDELLVWMVEEGNGAEALVFLDMQFLCMLLEARNAD